MSDAKRYADLQRQEQTLQTQISKLRDQLEIVYRERVTLEDALRPKIVHGGVYKAPDKAQTLRVLQEGKDWIVYDAETEVRVAYYQYSDALARALGIWGAKLV
jgi:hypothetical protein